MSELLSALVLLSTMCEYSFNLNKPVSCITASMSYILLCLSLLFLLNFSALIQAGQYIFTIRKIRKEDEAMYFCQSGPSHGMTLLNSTFIAVNDQTNQQNFISVEQNPPAASVQRGHSVSLQCSLLSEDKEKPVQCPGEHNVYWFRAGSGGYGPGIIYTHKNKTEEQDKRKCIYRLSTTVQDSSDSGTYYCAVATCGQILFGGGTKVETGTTLEQKY
uniref:Ig-like domain-containing protein n=1 Tax=Sphaeramia orbicularis TaxID=375764 RepID=A0A672ZNV3_9TELE